VHFTYLILFVAMAVYRKVEAWRCRSFVDPNTCGARSRLAELLPTSWRFAPRHPVYALFIQGGIVVSRYCLWREAFSKTTEEIKIRATVLRIMVYGEGL